MSVASLPQNDQESHLMRLFWLEACFTSCSTAFRTESVTLYLLQESAYRKRSKGTVSQCVSNACV